MSVDLRTRSEAQLQEVCTGEFFSRDLPALVRDRADCVGEWLRGKRIEPLGIDCDGEGWTLEAQGTAVRAVPGVPGHGPLVRLSAEEFSGLVNDLYTPITFFAGGTLDMPRGGIGQFLDWWLVLRALLDGRPIHLGGPLEFSGADGRPLDLTRSFSPGDPVAQMRHFLETAGFLHIEGLFDEAEMAAVSADIDRQQSSYREGDGASWWATTGSGERRLVRLQGFDRRSPATAALLRDPRFLQLGAISGDGHVHAGLQNNAIEALVKPLDVVEGISDLPWHKDCSLGRHSYDCCSLTVGISVTGAGPDSGQLRVIAGSHRVLMWPSLLADPGDCGLPVVDLPTRTGDVTVHLSCTHHMSQAPTACERRVLYTGFRLPCVAVDSSVAARERISRAREAAHVTVSQ